MEESKRVKFLMGQPTKMTSQAKFKLITSLLRAEFPPDYPVRIRRISKDCHGPDAPYGTCHLANAAHPDKKKYYVIYINKSVSWSQQLDTILHEWAHCLTWHQLPEGKDHGDIFARKYGVLYRRFIED